MHGSLAISSVPKAKRVTADFYGIVMNVCDGFMSESKLNAVQMYSLDIMHEHVSNNISFVSVALLNAFRHLWAPVCNPTCM